MKREYERDTEREEKLFHAIGNLPEDMVARAAEYKRPKHRMTVFSVWKGLALTACAALVLLGSTRLVSVLQKQSDRNVNKSNMFQLSADNHTHDSQEEAGDAKDAVKDTLPADGEAGEKDTVVPEGTAVGKSAEIKLWASGTMAYGKLETNENKSSATQQHGKDANPEETNDAQIAMEEGQTIALKTEKIDGKKGEKLSVLTFRFGQKEDNATYSLHSRTSNCKIITVSQNGIQKYINLPDAECTSGNTASFGTEWQTIADWTYNFVPEWTDTNIVDVIDICEKREDGEEYKLGRIVIGRQKEGEETKYYGIYQNKND